MSDFIQKFIKEQLGWHHKAKYACVGYNITDSNITDYFLYDGTTHNVNWYNAEDTQKIAQTDGIANMTYVTDAVQKELAQENCVVHIVNNLVFVATPNSGYEAMLRFENGKFIQKICRTYYDKGSYNVRYYTMEGFVIPKQFLGNNQQRIINGQIPIMRYSGGNRFITDVININNLGDTDSYACCSELSRYTTTYWNVTSNSDFDKFAFCYTYKDTVCFADEPITEAPPIYSNRGIVEDISWLERAVEQTVKRGRSNVTTITTQTEADDKTALWHRANNVIDNVSIDGKIVPIWQVDLEYAKTYNNFYLKDKDGKVEPTQWVVSYSASSVRRVRSYKRNKVYIADEITSVEVEIVPLGGYSNPLTIVLGEYQSTHGVTITFVMSNKANSYKDGYYDMVYNSQAICFEFAPNVTHIIDNCITVQYAYRPCNVLDYMETLEETAQRIEQFNSINNHICIDRNDILNNNAIELLTENNIDTFLNEGDPKWVCYIIPMIALPTAVRYVGKQILTVNRSITRKIMSMTYRQNRGRIKSVPEEIEIRDSKRIEGSQNSSDGRMKGVARDTVSYMATNDIVVVNKSLVVLNTEMCSPTIKDNALVEIDKEWVMDIKQFNLDTMIPDLALNYFRTCDGMTDTEKIELYKQYIQLGIVDFQESLLIGDILKYFSKHSTVHLINT